MLRCRGVAGEGDLIAIHGGGRGPDRGRRYKDGVGGLSVAWPITRRGCLVWQLRKHLRRHLREGSPWQWSVRRKLSDPRQELRGGQVGGEASETGGRSTGPRQRAAAARVVHRGEEGFSTRKTSRGGGERRHVRGEAAQLFG